MNHKFGRVLLVAIALVLLPWQVQADIKRVEPLNWWVGMKLNQPELLIYGDDIASYTPKVNYPGVKIREVKRVANKNYVFVTLDIAQRAKPGDVTLTFTKKSETLEHKFSLLAREEGSAARASFSPKDVVYLLTPDRFVNGDTRNDNVAGTREQANPSYKGGRHGGDIAGMRKALPYLKALGVTQVWPNPLTENDMPSYSYHGYAATDFYKIDPRFGTNDDFKQFVTEAKAQGIGVIQDIILNHIGSYHWWMQDLPEADWVHANNPYVETTHRREVVQDPNASKIDKHEFLNGWFVPTMPDLNQRNPRLAKYLIQNSIWWVEFAGLSGIREDTYGYSDTQFLSDWSKALTHEYPNLSIVGEEWTGNPALVAQWQRGKENPNGHVSYTNSMMDFPVHDAMRLALMEKEAFDTGLVKLYQAIANDFLYPDPSMLMIFPENHDTSRLYSYLNENTALNNMALVMFATLRGIPQIYQGAEVLMTSPRERDDGAVRAQMLGGFDGHKQSAFTGEGLNVDQKSTLAFTQKLLNWRKGNEVIHSGKMMHFVPKDGMYVYFRILDKRAVMVVVSKNSEAADLKLARFAEVMADKSQATNPMTGEIFTLGESIRIAPMSATIFELQ